MDGKRFNICYISDCNTLASSPSGDILVVGTYTITIFPFNCSPSLPRHLGTKRALLLELQESVCVYDYDNDGGKFEHYAFSGNNSSKRNDPPRLEEGREAHLVEI